MIVAEGNGEQQRKEFANAPRSNAEALGQIFTLMTQSKVHRSWRVVEIERYIVPALQHRQFRLFYDKTGIPFGYVSWAWLTKGLEERYLAGGYALQPQDWVGGDLPWIIDWLAPRGGTKYMLRDLRAQRETLWKLTPVKAIRPNKSGPGQKVVMFGRYHRRQMTGWKNRLINQHLGAQEG